VPSAVPFHHCILPPLPLPLPHPHCPPIMPRNRRGLGHFSSLAPRPLGPSAPLHWKMLQVRQYVLYFVPRSLRPIYRKGRRAFCAPALGVPFLDGSVDAPPDTVEGSPALPARHRHSPFLKYAKILPSLCPRSLLGTHTVSTFVLAVQFPRSARAHARAFQGGMSTALMGTPPSALAVAHPPIHVPVLSP